MLKDVRFFLRAEAIGICILGQVKYNKKLDMGEWAVLDKIRCR